MCVCNRLLLYSKCAGFTVCFTYNHISLSMYMLWFKFILGLNFISLCFKLIIIHYHTPKQREMKFKPRIKLNHNIYKLMLNKHYLTFGILGPFIRGKIRRVLQKTRLKQDANCTIYTSMSYLRQEQLV